MGKNFGFFILDEQSCNNKKGLIQFLSQKIFINKKCIFCGKTLIKAKDSENFKTPEAVQMHMKDKGHCMMNREYFSEYEPFYDFTDYNNTKLQKIISTIEEKMEIEVIKNQFII